MTELEVSEVFYSIQGETSMVGKPAVFIRFSGCNLNCSWCDTVYAREGGKKRKVSELLQEVKQYNCKLAVITGGEPLIQKNSVELMRGLVLKGFAVAVETNGSQDISVIPDGVKVIMDVKTPSSGESGKNDFSNIGKLKEKDEIKFVIKDRPDFDWSIEILQKNKCEAGEILFSPVTGKLSFNELAEWVKKDIPHARVQANIHKIYKIK